MGVLQIYYNTGDDSENTNDATNHPIAQTMTTVGAFRLSSIKLKLWKASGSTGTINVSIRATTGGVPTGGDLTSATLDFASIASESAPGDWYEFVFAPFALNAGTMYAIVMEDTADNSKINWRQAMTGAYSGGGEFTYNQGGGTWNSAAGRDLMFETYSLPFSPFPSHYNN